MAEHSKIEWTDATWNPVTGCSVVSPGCTNCYAMKLAGTRLQHHPTRQGLTTPSKAGPVWNGQVRLNQGMLTDPLRWRRPRRIFVCAHGDLFHESVPDAWIDQVFAVMALAPHHTFQVLTKRAERMREYLTRSGTVDGIVTALRVFEGNPGPAARVRCATPQEITAWDAHAHRFNLEHGYAQWPLPNVLLGVSAEDQTRADERIPHLLATPAAIRFLSAEPLLGPIDLCSLAPHPGFHGDMFYGDALRGVMTEERDGEPGRTIADMLKSKLDWIIAGGESGPGARPMHPDWARQLRDACAAAGVAFFFKQWGNWTPGENAPPIKGAQDGATWFDRGWHFESFTKREAEELTCDTEPTVWRIGKKAAGRLLDGVEHNAMPGAR